MPGWDDILNEIQRFPGPHDAVRRQYLARLADYTKRNAIAYYSAWLSKPDCPNVDITDNDMNGFMNAVKSLDTSKGLDLILHTPGGQPTAAESIVKYLRSKFHNDIRAIVPQMAMSAGTMIACAAKEIIMGKQSSLGPIDPQFNGIPAFNIKHEFEQAKKDLQKNSKNFDYWRILLSKYPAAFVNTAIDAINLSDVLLREWLGSCMFDAQSPADTVIVNRIVAALNDHNGPKSHARHYNIDYCQSIGLRITPLENDQDLQDLVLSVHHSFQHTFASSTAVKIVENHIGKAIIMNASPR